MFEVLFIFGALMLIGFFSNVVFQHTRVPESVVLIVLGFAIGTFGTSFMADYGIDLMLIRSLAPIFGALALVFFIFDAGLSLNLRTVFGQISFSTIFGLANIVFTFLVLTAILGIGFGWDPASAVLAAIILSGPSFYAIKTLTGTFPLSSQVRNVLDIEGVLAALLVPVAAMTALNYLGYLLSPSQLLQFIVSSFSISFLLGLLFGIAWINILAKFRITQYSYLLTSALLLMLYFIDFSFTQIGLVSIVIAGLVIGNYSDILAFLKLRWGYQLGESFSAPKNDIMLFVRTFFFSYIGLTLSPTNISLQTIYAATIIALGILLARLIIIRAMTSLFKHTFRSEDFMLATMLPRDLLTAALAVFVFLPIYSQPTYFSIETIFISIIISTLLTTVLAHVYEAAYRRTLLFRTTVNLKDGRKATVRAISADDAKEFKRFINDLVSEGALIAFDRTLRTHDANEIMQSELGKMNDGDAVVWVGEANGTIIARVKAERKPHRERGNVELSLYVAKDYRGQGLGSTLMKMMIEEAKKRFAPKNIYLSVLTSNEPAINMYKKMGFKVVGRLPDWDETEQGYVDEYYMVYEPNL